MKDCFLLFETLKTTDLDSNTFIFYDPVEIIETKSLDSFEEIFKKIEKLSKKYYLAGYISYEAGFYLQEGVKTHFPKSFPFSLVKLGVFKKAEIFPAFKKEIQNCYKKFLKEEKNYKIKNLNLSQNFSEYKEKIKRIKEYLREGDIYQLNYTLRYKFDFEGSAFRLYQNLKEKQKTSYTAFLKFKDEYILSLSPELFFRIEQNRIICKPMKGTTKRGKNIYEDKIKAKNLFKSVKNRAENVMIVDLVRNDLGRICKEGSVKVTELFEVEKYETLFQMTSTIEGILKKNIAYLDIFKSLFPCGSITGAPKIRSMEIINELENSCRKVYCGAVGIIFPSEDFKKCVFNVPIRTVIINKDKGEMGAGGGIVVSSKALSEYEECKLKANFLIKRYKEFRLFESILYNKGYAFLEEHLKRLKSSAEYFGFNFDILKIRQALKEVREKLSDKKFYKVKLFLDKKGKVEVEWQILKNLKFKGKNQVILSKTKTDPCDIFLYHKTTNRYLYDSEYRKALNKGFCEVIFTNKKGEVTEGAISNIFILKDGIYFTPPVNAGLLDGVYRRYFIKINRKKIIEKPLFLQDLIKADKIFICNSVRGLFPVTLVLPEF